MALELRSFSKRAGFTGVRCAFMVVPKTVTGVGADGARVSLNALWGRRHTTKFNGASYVVQRGAAAAYSPAGLEQTTKQIAFYMENARLLPWGSPPLASPCSAVCTRHTSGCARRAAPPRRRSSTGCSQRRRSWAPRAPGFGPAGEGYFRLSGFNSRANIEEAIQRIRRVFG